MAVTRQQVLGFRMRTQELDTAGPRRLDDVAILGIGVQDTGPDGAGWTLVNRGVEPRQLTGASAELVLAWTVRGAPHFYRRRDIAGVAAATAPYSDADAAKRIYDAAKPLREAGIRPLEALDVVAARMREIVAEPTVKGELSARLTQALDQPYLRYCRPCQATHAHEQPFRLASLRAGLELRPDTSPPVLQRIPSWTGPAAAAPPELDVVRSYLHLLGPATPKLVAGYLDAPVQDVKARWPEDAVEVVVDGQTRWVLAEDRAILESPDADPAAVRLLPPFDLFLQARDRDLLLPDATRRKQLWVVLGRPGAVLMGSEIVGTWRPRSSGGKLRLLADTWSPVPEAAVAEQAERLAAYRGVGFAGLVIR
jgi:hypothetical protein